ncbi:MAG: mandelate racemase/muconate lactonizing enzyme family protein [Acidobacteria bacterium]|nr:mandelate racemase/muconate lactonizing enzyme family protein [Acidobacteriota bacterium]
MRITSVRAFPIRLPRDLASARGTAGSPTSLHGEGIYRWSTAYPVLYSTHFETALIQVRLDNGLEGWGEAQAPLAPEVACTITELLLRPVLESEEFDGSAAGIAALWNRMYSTMRVRGQTGGFMLDAISGVDLALWDLAGKLAGQPVSALLAASPKTTVPAYLSGTTGTTPDERAAFAARFGLPLVKLYFDSDWNDLLRTADSLRSRGMDFAVDALWHLPPASAVEMALQLDARRAHWLECPLYPEEHGQHIELAQSIATPIALGESYRTRHELRPLAGACRILQPDLGRSGLTESMAIAGEFAAKQIVPHVSIAMGPQLAAAIHLAAAAPNCNLCEYNPNVLDTANAFLARPLELTGGVYHVPQTPGLGIVWNERIRELVGGE